MDKEKEYLKHKSSINLAIMEQLPNPTETNNYTTRAFILNLLVPHLYDHLVNTLIEEGTDLAMLKALETKLKNWYLGKEEIFKPAYYDLDRIFPEE